MWNILDKIRHFIHSPFSSPFFVCFCFKVSSSQVTQLVGVLPHTPNGCGFWSGHVPRLWVWGDQLMFLSRIHVLHSLKKSINISSGEDLKKDKVKKGPSFHQPPHPQFSLLQKLLFPDCQNLKPKNIFWDSKAPCDFWYSPGEGPFPGILDLFGSGGGLCEYRASLLAGHGFAVLALAYFRFEDLPENLNEVHLEYFEEAVDFMLQHPKVGFGAYLNAEERRSGHRAGSKSPAGTLGARSMPWAREAPSKVLLKGLLFPFPPVSL